MHAEIFLAIMVLAVALLVTADFFRRASEGPHEHVERPVHDAGSAGRGAFTPSQNAGAGRVPGASGASAGGNRLRARPHRPSRFAQARLSPQDRP